MKAYTLAALAAASLLTLTACGGGNGYGNNAAASGPSTSPVSGGTGLHVASTSLGKVVVDSRGMTVYLLTADKPNHSTCSSTCLAYWPAVAPSKGTGISAKVGSTATPGGAKTATVGGWPVYTFVQDSKPGDVTGEGISNFGGTWYAVSPSGQPVKAGGSPSKSSSSGYTGRGY
jgi:predicted lipoprotein with Yx(FWY)xxD motif